MEEFSESRKNEIVDALLRTIDAAKDNKSKNDVALRMMTNCPWTLFRKNEEGISPFIQIILDENFELLEKIFNNKNLKETTLSYKDSDGELLLAIGLISANNLQVFQNFLQSLSREELQKFCYHFDNFRISTIEHITSRCFFYDSALTDTGEFNQDKIRQIRKLAAARTFLKFAYPTDGSFMGTNLACNCQKVLLHQKEEEKDQKFLEALKIIYLKKLTAIGDKKVKVVNLKYDEHDAFAIIICDFEGKPQSLAYVDSYIPLGNGGEGKEYHDGVYAFALQEKYQDDIAILEEDLQSEFGGTKLYNLAYFLEHALGKFVVCDEYNAPKIVSQSIPTKRQPREKINCSYKSSNIAMRFLVQMAHPEMKYELGEDGQPHGDLHDDYKRFRRKITDIAIGVLNKQLAKTNEESDIFDKAVYPMIIKDLELMQKKAEKKDDKARIARMSEILDQHQKGFQAIQVEPLRKVKEITPPL